jgi:hypothetical protein
LGIDGSVLLDRKGIVVGAQVADLGVGEMTGEAINYFPAVGDVSAEVDVGLDISTLLEGNDVPPWDGIGHFPNLDEGRRSGESGENAESEGDKVLGEHFNNAGDGSGRC